MKIILSGANIYIESIRIEKLPENKGDKKR
jgi:hypothetical protein